MTYETSFDNKFSARNSIYLVKLFRFLLPLMHGIHVYSAYHIYILLFFKHTFAYVSVLMNASDCAFQVEFISQC